MLLTERLNLHIHARRQIELHQRIHRLLRRLQNIEQAACGCGSQTAPATSYPRAANAARSTCSSSWAVESAPQSALRCAAPFPQSRRSTDPECGSRKPSTGFEFSLFQSRFTLSTPPGVSRKERTGGRLQAAFICLCASGRSSPARIQTPITSRAKAPAATIPTYCTISAIVPAPTVCPPSRIAKRKPFSIATGVISSITRLTLSPGITISVPAGNSATPVTSVVRR